jgi:hypothetical protein
MILFLTLIYVAFLAVLIKFKIVPLNTFWKLSPAGGGHQRLWLVGCPHHGLAAACRLGLGLYQPDRNC